LHALPCARFYPTVKYKYMPGPNGTRSQKVILPLRLHFKPDGVSADSAGIFRDLIGIPWISALEDNPIHSEQHDAKGVTHGTGADIHSDHWDNYHQSWNTKIDLPFDFWYGGCPECVHVHWRWGELAKPTPLDDDDYNHGLPRIPSRSTQDVNVGVVSYKGEEEDPVTKRNGWRTLDDGRLGANVVFWYEGTGNQPEDAFFTHGGFFSPRLGGYVKNDSFQELGDITALVTIQQKSKPTVDLKTGEIVQKFVIVNSSKSDIPLPIFVKPVGLDSRITLKSPQVVRTEDPPILNRISPGKRAWIELRFVRQAFVEPKYEPRFMVTDHTP